MSAEYREKLRSLTLRPRRTDRKVTVEGDRTEGSVVTEWEDRQDVNVFIPPVDNVMDVPTWRDVKEEVADMKADAARKDAI